MFASSINFLWSSRSEIQRRRRWNELKHVFPPCVAYNGRSYKYLQGTNSVDECSSMSYMKNTLFLGFGKELDMDDVYLEVVESFCG